jgi:hypothetical protein
MSDVEETTDEVNEDSVYVGVDPDYQNAAYPVGDPGPMDETKEAMLENEANCAVAEPGEWTDYYPTKESSNVASKEDAAEEEEGLDEEEDLDAMTLTELRTRAAELNISGRSSMDHDELVDAIAAAEA